MSGVATCPVCSTALLALFRNGVRWVMECPECLATEARHGVLLAWPDLSRDTVMLAVGGERVEMAVPEAPALERGTGARAGSARWCHHAQP